MTLAIADGFVTISVDLGSSPSLGARRPLWCCTWPSTTWPRSSATVVATVLPWLPPRSSPGNPLLLRLPPLLLLLLLDLYLLHPCVCCCYAILLPCLLGCCAAILAMLMCMPCSTLSLLILFLCLLAHCDVLIICVHVYIMCNFLLVLVHMPIVLVVGLG
jgi:hypothetical protein